MVIEFNFEFEEFWRRTKYILAMQSLEEQYPTFRDFAEAGIVNLWVVNGR